MLRSAARLVAATAVVAATLLVGGGAATAHDNIESSSPANGDVLSEPIDHVTIDFGEEISDAVQMFLRYEGADGEVEQIGGTVTKTSPTTARLDFPLLDREGTYFVNYIGPVPADGHVITGAIGFVYGAPTVLVSDDPNVTSSTPFARETIADPVDRAEIVFAAPITNVRFFFAYDEGDGENFSSITVEQEQVADDTIVVSFDELDREGTYILSYLARYAQSDEEISGDIPFFLGAPSSEPGSSYPWLPVLLAASVILAAGGFFTWRRMERVDEDADDPADDASSADVDEDLADVRV